MNDRLHSKDIVNIALDNKFLFSDCKISELFKSMNIGEHRSKCIINRKIQDIIMLSIFQKRMI